MNSDHTLSLVAALLSPADVTQTSNSCEMFADLCDLSSRFPIIHHRNTYFFTEVTLL